MARLRDLQKKVDGNTKIKAMAAIAMLLETLETYQLTKNENGVKLTAYIHLFKQEFTARDLFSIAQPLGEWLCKLPKGIWDNKEITR